MTASQHAHAVSLTRFIDQSPSPYHVAQSAERLLLDAGFTATDGRSAGEPGRFVRSADGALFAWVVPESAGPTTPFRVVGAHTDSPNLRLKPLPNAHTQGYARASVEVYGGVLLNSWLDRDLGLSGRVTVRVGDRSEGRLVFLNEPLFRVPQLAIHLDRDVNNTGLVLNKHAHLRPIFGLEDGADDLMDLVAGELDVPRSDILGADLMFHDTNPSGFVGVDDSFISAPRLDNQLSCHAAVTALSGITDPDAIAIVALFDHEEVGSVSSSGAATAATPVLLDQIADSRGATPADRVASRAGSLLISADNAHATHPNYPERHDPGHRVMMNGGPVLKHNVNQRYTTDAHSAATFHLAAERAGVPTQHFSNRADLACGSTIGPTLAAGLGIRALDMGCAQLAMHSCRELAGSEDPWSMTLLLAELLGGTG
ncbi:MAG: M18 family aminopeptidase [Acidimicrobiales bacterium]|nr:M18 family aminopeptidase [Acidimicrobiales bacterium]RZV42585.1 MAG: M18 family aminopeptidase [Acidimicrobiales bacterium]